MRIDRTGDLAVGTRNGFEHRVALARERCLATRGRVDPAVLLQGGLAEDLPGVRDFEVEVLGRTAHVSDRGRTAAQKPGEHDAERHQGCGDAAAGVAHRVVPG